MITDCMLNQNIFSYTLLKFLMSKGNLNNTLSYYSLYYHHYFILTNLCYLVLFLN